MERVVKPGSIKDPDQLFNDLAPKIGMNYSQVGLSLGLDEETLTNELDSGVFMMYPANRKAMKMLKLWQRSVAERDCTYKALAAILKKHKIDPDAFCYMDSPPDSESGGAGAAGPSTPNIPDKNESTVNVSCENRDRDLCEEGGPSAAPGLSAFVNTHLIWKGRKELYVKFMNVQDLEKCRFNKQNILGWANSWRDKEPCIEADKVIPKFVECVERDDQSDIRVEFAGVGSKDGSFSYIGKQAQDHKNERTMFLNLSNGGDDYKEHTVVHEFGHALGMLHEHQRPEIWSIVKMYLAPGSEWYKENNNYKGFVGAGTETSATYDTSSVMHYPNFKYGIKYKTVEAIENDHLNQEHAAVLKAIVSMDGTSFCSKPSDDDIRFLREKYDAKDSVPPRDGPKYGPPKDEPPKDEPPKDEPPKDEPPKDERAKDERPKDEPGPSTTQKPTLKELMKRLKCVAEWRHIGVQLDFDNADLNEIKQNHPNDNRSCLDELMGRWLDRGDASWGSLVAALKECRVNKEIIDSIISDFQ